MQLLKDMILEQGTVEGDDILKVDRFLNHRLDVELLNEIGKEFKRRFNDKPINKILTIEASGIAISIIAAQYFNVPVVFAKKVVSKNLDKDTYESEVYSFTKARNYTIRVSKKYLDEDDNVLVIDDFMAEGRAALGLMDLVEQAGAKVEGIGIVIEKDFQAGGKVIREKGIKLESLARIKKFEDSKPVFL